MEFDIAAVALGVGAVALGGGDVVGDLFRLAVLEADFFKKRAMHDEVRVAADGGGEVGVLFLGQSVVPQRLGGVAGAHEGF